MKWILAFLITCVSLQVAAQQIDSTPGQLRNTVVIFKDPRIDYLQKVYASKSKTKVQSTRIYRIQLTSSKSRTEVNEQKSQFSSKYPGIPVFMSFDPPTFKLRVGNFASRQDADQFLREVRKSYPGSFIVDQ